MFFFFLLMHLICIVHGVLIKECQCVHLTYFFAIVGNDVSPSLDLDYFLFFVFEIFNFVSSDNLVHIPNPPAPLAKLYEQCFFL